jgi:hypothetical protein
LATAAATRAVGKEEAGRADAAKKDATDAAAAALLAANKAADAVSKMA